MARAPTTGHLLQPRLLFPERFIERIVGRRQIARVLASPLCSNV